MKISRFLPLGVFALGLIVTSSSQAQTSNVTPYIAKNIPAVALNNILNAERIFCYTVKIAPNGYKGYTLDQMALTGYCGSIGEEISAFTNEFFKSPNNVLQTTASCQIDPKIVFRFIRGIDFTDVLFSDTCPSFTVFYGGTIKSFNAEPAQKSLEAIATIFDKGRIDFVSPALLNQTMPMGVVLNEQDKQTLSKQNSSQPVRNRAQPEQQKPTTSQGWNKLKN